MNEKLRLASIDFAQYLQSIVRLDELQKITDTLDQELEASQRSMMDIKSMFDSLPATQPQVPEGILNRQEEVTKNFLEAPSPNGLLPDMCENTKELEDLDGIITSMKSRAEMFKRDFEKIAPQISGMQRTHSFGDLQLDEYASSLDQLNKQVMNIKLTKKNEINKRNLALEEKLSQLCQDVHLFTQMIQANTVLNDSNRNWTSTTETSTISHYEILITKLLAGINEVSYLLKNKN